MPISDGTVDRLERKDVELAFHDIEDLFADACTCAPTSNPGPMTTSNVDVDAG